MANLKLWLYNHPSLQILLLVIVLACTLFFGLRPKDFNFSNDVAWVEGHNGLRFGKYGIAYTQPFGGESSQRLDTADGFSITLDLKPETKQTGGFGLIVCLYTGDDDKQLIVGQWRSHIIVMNGDDYAHKKKIPRIVYDVSGQDKARIVLAITTSSRGSRIYANGLLAKENKSLKLFIPGKEAIRLTLGNSVNRRNTWQGEVYGMAFHDRPLSSLKVQTQYEYWVGAKRFELKGMADPLLFYEFENSGAGRVVKDRGRTGLDLHFPTKVQNLGHTILSTPWHSVKLDRGFFQDVAVNLLGFVPLGCLVMMYVGSTLSRTVWQVALMTVLLGFLLSLGIEIAQTWMPSRSPSLLDLALNTAGTLAGSFIGYKVLGVRCRVQGIR